MVTPQVSVVVPTRNRSQMLRRTLEAILRQQDVDLEVIVVNEACEDDTVEMVASLDDPRVSMVHHDAPRGLPAARNSGLTKAAAHWVAFCDDDDTWAPTKLAAQLAALDAAPEAKWCACGAVHVDSSFRLLAGYQPPPAGDVARLVLQDNYIPGGGSGTMALTSLVRDLGAFDTSLKWGEDWDMWSRLSLNAPMAGVSRPLVAYLIHDQSMSRNSPRFNRDVAIIEEKYAEERSARRLARSSSARARSSRHRSGRQPSTLRGLALPRQRLPRQVPEIAGASWPGDHQPPLSQPAAQGAASTDAGGLDR